MGVRRKLRAIKESTRRKALETALQRAASPPPSSKPTLFGQSEEIEGQFEQYRADLVDALHDRSFENVSQADLAYAVRCFVSDSRAEQHDLRSFHRRDVRPLARAIAARFDFAAARGPLDDYSLSEAVEVLSEAYNVWLAREDAARRV